MKKLIILSAIVILSSCNFKTEKELADVPSSQNELESYGVQMADMILAVYPDLWSIEEREAPKWTYTYGLVSLALMDLWESTGDKKYFDYAKKYADAVVTEQGIIKTYKKEDYNIDKLNSGKLLFRLYAETKDPKYKIAIDTLREQLKGHPRTEIGGFWHKKRYPHQMWLDGLYMGAPFYAQYANENNEPESFDEITAWFINMEALARDAETGLLYHGWDESKEQKWANNETGLSPHFWGRGMGWYGMALVDVLDFIPEDHKDYNNILDITRRFAEAIVKFQDAESGVWYQVLDQGSREGNYLEASVSSMFSYFLLKAINKSYIDKEIYKESALRAYEGTVEEFVKTNDDGQVVLTQVCAVAGLGGDPYRDGSYEYYINERLRDNDPKGVGPFIMAAIQYNKLEK